MVKTIDVDKIRTGWHALDVRGEKIGDVVEIGSDYALVRMGLGLSKRTCTSRWLE